MLTLVVLKYSMDHNTDVQLVLLIQGNFDDIPLIRQSIVPPIIIKIDQVVLPFVLEQLSQQVLGVGNSGILIVLVEKYQC